MTLLADAHTHALAARLATASDVTDAELDGAWVVDVRERTTAPETAVEDAHVGWLVPWEDDIVLLAGSPDVLAPRHDSPWR